MTEPTRSKRRVPTPTRARMGLLGAMMSLALAGGSAELSAQVPLFLVNPETEVASVGFRFPDTHTLAEGPLRRQLALLDPGLAYRVKSVLAVLPLISSPERSRFHPPSLLRDVVRLERYYVDAGFPDPEVTYDVTLDTAANAVDVTFVVHEGAPLVLDTVVVRDSAGAALETRLPSDLRPSWRDLEADLADTRGERLGASRRARIRDRVVNWLRDRGYPYPTASVDTVSAEGGVRYLLTVEPGSRMRVGAVVVEGNRRLTAPVLRREVPLNEGDWFSRARLAEGQSELFGLDMVRIAVAETQRDSTRDDRVDVRLRVTEGALHLVSGRAGYGVSSGLSADASWSHRNFLGGARTLEVSSVARTGVLAREGSVARRYGFSVSLRQPWLFDHRVEGVLRPFVEYRDDFRDESMQWGAEASALFSRGPRRNLSVRYSLTSRRVFEAGASAILGSGTNIVEILSGLDTLNLDRRTSSISAVGRWARAPGAEMQLGGEVGPRPDWSVFGSMELAAPPELSTVEYGKFVGEVSGLLPLAPGVGLRGRIGGGRVFPFGVSVPASDGSNRLETYLRLRDAVLTAGGSRDVRGWGTELLGPKLPDLQEVEGEGVVSARYLPLGGLARWTASLQVEVPMPLVGQPHGLHGFLDAGRVWTPDGRFLPTEDPILPGQLGDEVRFGTGMGVSIGTPVGAVQLDLGYKLNPSPLDLRDPVAVGQALVDGRPLDDVPTESLRRWHLHLSIGGVP